MLQFCSWQWKPGWVKPLQRQLLSMAHTAQTHFPQHPCNPNFYINTSTLRDGKVSPRSFICPVATGGGDATLPGDAAAHQPSHTSVLITMLTLRDPQPHGPPAKAQVALSSPVSDFGALRSFKQCPKPCSPVSTVSTWDFLS